VRIGTWNLAGPWGEEHLASAMAASRGLTFCSSILPWRSCGNDPWVGARQVDKTEAATATLLESLPQTDLVWGGDWNHALTGREYVGTNAGRAHLAKAIDRLGLQVPTTGVAARHSQGLSIDHVAVPADRRVISAERLAASNLSDHDAYVVEIADPA